MFARPVSESQFDVICEPRVAFRHLAQSVLLCHAYLSWLASIPPCSRVTQPSSCDHSKNDHADPPLADALLHLTRKFFMIQHDSKILESRFEHPSPPRKLTVFAVQDIHDSTWTLRTVVAVLQARQLSREDPAGSPESKT